MPRIPIYQERQQVSQNIALPQAVEGMAGKGLIEAGKGLAALAKGMYNIEEENGKAEAAKVLSDMSVERAKWYEDFKKTYNAADDNFTDQVMKFEEDLQAKYATSVKNQFAKRYIADKSLAEAKLYTINAIGYQAEVNQLHTVQQIKDSFTGDSVAIRQNPSADFLKLKLQEKTELIDSSNRLDEKTKINLKAEYKELLGTVGVNEMLVNSPNLLIAQYDDAKKRGLSTSGNPYLDLIPPERWEGIIKQARSNQDMTDTENGVISIWKANGPKTDIDPTNIDVLRSLVREQTAGKSKEVKDAANSMLDDLIRDHENSAKERVAAKVGWVWDRVLRGESMAAIKSTPEWRALPGDDRATLTSQIETFRKPKDAGEPKTTNEQYAMYYQIVGDAQNLASMTQDQILAMAPALGNTLVRQVLAKHSELQDPTKFASATVDDNDFKTILFQTGIKKLDPYDKKNNPVVGKVRSQVESLISVQQAQQKRKLERQEVQQVIKGVLADTVTVEHWWEDKEVPTVILDADNLKDAYISIGDKRVNLLDITIDERNQIIKARTSRGLPVTEKDIAAHWLKAKEYKGSGASGSFR
jgi:hypothetical protein